MQFQRYFALFSFSFLSCFLLSHSLLLSPSLIFKGGLGLCRLCCVFKVFFSRIKLSSHLSALWESLSYLLCYSPSKSASSFSFSLSLLSFFAFFLLTLSLFFRHQFTGCVKIVQNVEAAQRKKKFVGSGMRSVFFQSEIQPLIFLTNLLGGEC